MSLSNESKNYNRRKKNLILLSQEKKTAKYQQDKCEHKYNKFKQKNIKQEQ